MSRKREDLFSCGWSLRTILCVVRTAIVEVQSHDLKANHNIRHKIHSYQLRDHNSLGDGSVCHRQQTFVFYKYWF